MENKEIKYNKVTNSINRTEWKTEGYTDNEYAKVYFRLRVPTFDPVNGCFQDTKDHDNFYTEIKEILGSIGWNVNLADCIKDKQYLYIHPQMISGTVRKNDIKRIAETLEKYINYVDIYDDVYDVSDEEYLDMINAKSAKIDRAILKAAVTKRAYTFVSAADIIENIGHKVRYPRLGLTDKSGHIYGNKNELAYSVVDKCVHDLISAGKLFTIEQNEKLYIRTPNKTEQKKMKINLDI